MGRPAEKDNPDPRNITETKSVPAWYEICNHSSHPLIRSFVAAWVEKKPKEKLDKNFFVFVFSVLSRGHFKFYFKNCCIIHRCIWGLNFVYLSANAPRPPRSAERRPRGSLRNPKVLTLELGREPYHSFQKASGCFESKCRRKFPFQRESKNSVWMRDLKILWGETWLWGMTSWPGLAIRHPRFILPQELLLHIGKRTVSPPPLAIIEWGRWFDGKGAFAAFAHFTASPPIGSFTIWRYCPSLESLWAFSLHLMIWLHWHFETFPRCKETELSLNLSILDK